MGEAEGLSLRKLGRVGMSEGRSAAAALIAAWTSCAALSISRDSENWIRMAVLPSVLVEVISVMPEIAARRRSSGAATEAAMVSGSAPGREAATRMVGKSTVGRLATGSRR